MPKPIENVASLDSLDGEIAAPPVARPANYARSLFHVASGAFSLMLLRLAPDRVYLIGMAGAFFLSAWAMETARRTRPGMNDRLMRFFGPVAHAHERHKVNSSTWYVTALFLLASLAPLRAAEVGVAVLALADPAAGLVGRRFGRTRLRAGRSLEGTLTFLVVGMIASLAVLVGFYALPWTTMFLLAFAGGASGALMELASTRLDDNFTIPVATTLAVALAQLFFHVS